MAAPIAHLFLAIQILFGPLNGKFNEKEFVIGTSFPDIRYLNIISRDETHFKNVTLENIKNETNSFRAGMMFHSLVDIEREKYMIRNYVNDKVPNFKFRSQSLKFAEDQILLETFNPTKYANYFDEILNQEKEFGIKEDDIKKWHFFLKDYFKSKLSVDSLLNNYFDLNFPNASYIKKWVFSTFYAKAIGYVIRKITSDKNLKRAILDFYLNFKQDSLAQ